MIDTLRQMHKRNHVKPSGCQNEHATMYFYFNLLNQSKVNYEVLNHNFNEGSLVKISSATLLH